MPATASITPSHKTGQLGTRSNSGGAIDGAVVVIVSVEVAEVAPGVTLVCESAHELSDGTPEQVSDTGLVKAPNFEPIVTV
jgi:hypothetical protein